MPAHTTSEPTARSPRLPWTMFWAGLLVRVLYMTLAHTYHVRPLQDHFQFGWEMGRIARALATGYGFSDPFNGHSGPTAWTPPLYPILLAGVFKIFGVYTAASAWVILTINCIFSAAVAPAVYEIATRCFHNRNDGKNVALWSGWLWALYPAAMQYSVRWIWEMSLTVFLFSWVLVFALRARGVGQSPEKPRQTTAQWAAFGLLWGLIALSNSSLLLFLPCCGIWMIWDAIRAPRNLAPILTRAVLAAILCAACITPWIIRNWIVFHAFIPMRANFGAEFYESVLPENHGFPWMATLSLAENSPDFLRYKRLGEPAYSKQQGERAKAILATHKATFKHHILKRIYFFWSSVPHPIEKGFLMELGREMPFAFTSISGLLGLALALRRRVPAAWLFAMAFFTLPLIYYVITVQARFRHPLEPIITILSVYLFQSADRTRTWSWQPPRNKALSA
ncbi:glycosyltransferase family 39 protein [Granulicella arctica]|uniref:Glycosyltransferase RgtA/B/C/D-like domain-containing protein n=1 Tax=Granulicella arctica TaxID=940613 RepID=A0A7Y9TEP1_9BACT|nr:glycosyltransferase family 39 protein [Granulicella arctica]NYF77891.1 hypothetical protein [Granulicella arctica]